MAFTINQGYWASIITSKMPYHELGWENNLGVLANS